MIKNILFVSLLLAGGTHWASAQSQTTVGAAASLPASKKENMTISQLFQRWRITARAFALHYQE